MLGESFMERDVIETGRLVMRGWRIEDAEALFKYASDGRVSELALWPRHESVEMSRYVIENFFMTNPDCFAIVLKQSGEPIGCIGLVPSGDEHCAINADEREVGYWIGYPHWGQGYVTEALEGIIGYCRSEMGLKSLVITTDSKNIASQRVAEKCKFNWMSDYTHNGIPSKSYKLTL